MDSNRSSDGRTDVQSRPTTAPEPMRSPQAEIPAASLPNPFAALNASARQAQAAVADYMHATVDGVRVAIRNALLKVMLLAVLGVIGVVAIAIGLVLVLIGAATGLAAALGAPLWAGYLIVGALAIIVPMLVSRIQLRKLKLNWLEKARAKYAARNARRSA